eukprot:g755.t1
MPYSRNPWTRKKEQDAEAERVKQKYAKNTDWASERKAADGTAQPRSRTNRSNYDNGSVFFTWLNAITRVATMLTAVWLGYAAVDNVKMSHDISKFGDLIFHDDITYAEQGRSMMLMHAYYCAFAVLIFFSEIRFAWMKRSILKPFRFVHGYVGRGTFYVLVGLPYVMIFQWRLAVPGALLTASGILQIFMPCIYHEQTSAEYQINDEEETSAARPSSPKKSGFFSRAGNKKKASPQRSTAAPKKAKGDLELGSNGGANDDTNDNPWSKGGGSVNAETENENNRDFESAPVEDAREPEPAAPVQNKPQPGDEDYNPWLHK